MTLAHYLDAFVLGIYPYVAITVMLVGSLARYVLAPYTWKSASSEIWAPRQLMLGSNLFHVGVLGLFAGHIAGLFTPLWVFDLFGISPRLHQLLEEIIGSIFMVTAIVGLALLLHRRLFNRRVRATSRRMDIFIDVLLMLTLLLGGACVVYSALYDQTGAYLVIFGLWARGVMTFQGDAWTLMVGAPWIYKLHIFFGLTVFLLLPFSRLVHIWSGFATLLYLPRRYQLMRQWAPRGSRP